MAQPDKERPVTVTVTLTNGANVTVTGPIAPIIAYLAEQSLFFNDKRTVGNFTFMLKGGDIQFKQDVTIQA